VTWTHRERVLAALHHEEADRVPIDFGALEFTSISKAAYERLKDHLGIHHKTRMASVKHGVAIPDEAVLQRFDVDTRGVVLGSYEGGHDRMIDENTMVDLYGVSWRRTGETEISPFINVDGPFTGAPPSIEDIEAFDWPDPDNPSLVRGVRQQVEALKSFGDHAVCLYLPGGIFFRASAMRGFENSLKDLYKQREMITALMDQIEDYCVRLSVNAVRAAGPQDIDVIFFAEDLATQDGAMFDPEGIYAKMIKPRHANLISSVKALSGAKIGWHCCGSAYPFIEHLIDIGVEALNPVQVTARNMEPDRLKSEFGKRVTFWGGINSQEILPNGSTAEVAAETCRIIEILGKGGGYVLNSVHNIQGGVPPENVVSMFDTGRAHRYDGATETQQ